MEDLDHEAGGQPAERDLATLVKNARDSICTPGGKAVQHVHDDGAVDFLLSGRAARNTELSIRQGLQDRLHILLFDRRVGGKHVALQSVGPASTGEWIRVRATEKSNSLTLRRAF